MARMVSWKQQQQTVLACCNAASQMPYCLGCKRTNYQISYKSVLDEFSPVFGSAHVNANSYHAKRNPGSAFAMQLRRCRSLVVIAYYGYN
jgi:hypothetical protein